MFFAVYLMAMDTNIKLRWTVVVLLAVVLAQGVLLVMTGRYDVSRFRDAGKMTDWAYKLFGKSGTLPEDGARNNDVVARDGMDEIQEIHARIARLFDDLTVGAERQNSGLAQPVGAVAGVADGVCRLQREIDGIFERAFHDGLWRRARHPLDWTWERVAVSPGLRMTEDDAGYEITVALEGVDRMGVDVRMQDGILSISTRGAHGYYVTRLRLPGAVDEQNIHAWYDDNFLRIRAPKAAARETLATGRQII